MMLDRVWRIFKLFFALSILIAENKTIATVYVMSEVSEYNVVWITLRKRWFLLLRGFQFLKKSKANEI